NFKVPNADAQAQMEQMQAGVQKIRDDHLGPAEQGLTHASKNLDESEAARPEPSASAPAPDTKAAAAPKGREATAKGTQAKASPAGEQSREASPPDANGQAEAPGRDPSRTEE